MTLSVERGVPSKERPHARYTPQLPSEAHASAERLPWLDVLRGLMALSVAVYHLAVWTHVFTAGTRLSSNIVVLGVHSVQGFFVISGFCFFHLYRRAPLTGSGLLAFHVKRYFRIAPLYYVALLLTFASSTTVGLRSPSRLVENVTLSFGLFHPNHAMVLGGWSIGVEYVFYLAFPLLLWLVRLRRGLPLLLAALAALAAVYNFRVVPRSVEGARFNAYVQLGNHAFLFVLGGAFAALRGKLRVRLSGRAIVLGSLLVAACLQLWLAPFYDHFLVMQGWGRLVCLSACCAVVLLCGLSRTTLAPALWPLTVLGDLSYALYLLHPLAWYAVRGLVPVKQQPALAFALTLALGLSLAALVHYALERPMMRWGRVLSQRVRRRDGRAAALALLCLCALLPGQARADPFHFQGVPLGQRALGFGGAFTGLADDPSAAYYNPAGLVRAGDSALSATFTLNAFDRQFIRQGYRTSLGVRSLRHHSDPTLPGSVAVLKRIGKRQKDGERNHAISLSTFTVDQRLLRFDTEVINRMNTGIATLSVERNTRTVWHGFSYAYRINERWSVGATGFLSMTRTRYRDEIISADLGPLLEGDDRYESHGGVWASHATSTDVKGLLGRLGVLYRHDDKLRLGLMFQPPSIHVRGRANVRHRELDIDRAQGMGSFLTVQQRGLPSHNPMPWELRLGASYRLNERLLLSADVSLYGASGSKNKPVVHVGERTPNKDTGAIAEVGYFESDRWHRPFSGNLAVGGEARVWRSIALRAGIFTSLSAAPPVPRVSSVYVPSDVHRVGGALSVGINAGGFDLSVGLTGLWGRGDGLALDTRDESETLYRRTTVRDGTLYVFLTGIRNVVSTLAKKADQKLQEIRKARAQAAAEEAAAAFKERSAARRSRGRKQAEPPPEQEVAPDAEADPPAPDEPAAEPPSDEAR